MSLTRSVFLSLLLLIAACTLAKAQPAAAATFDTTWKGSGPGTIKVVGDGGTADPRFEYSTSRNGAWAFNAAASAAGTMPVKWDYSGFHAWFQVRVSLERFISRNGVDVLKESLVNAGPVNCCTAPSGGFAYKGTTTFQLQKGDVYGFRMAGSNFDSDPTVKGTLALTEVDATPPVIKPVVTGAKAANGVYIGPVSVKWQISEADSRILSSTGCADATVTEDTAGKTFTCKATSRGGEGSASVTIARDTTAPELTVPATVVQQAASASGAAVNYATSATDKLDPSPAIACSPASGSTFPVGNTTVTCTATDAAGNAVSKSFQAVVFNVSNPVIINPTGPKKIDAVLAFRFTISKSTTRLVTLVVKNIPAGSTVKVTCNGKTCPKSLKGKGITRVSKSTSINLAKWVKAKMKGGTTINVTVSSPGAISAVKKLTVRKGKAPVVGR